MSRQEVSQMTSGARELVAHEVLVVDADPATQRGLLQLLAPAGLHVSAVQEHDKAVELVAVKFFGVVIVDLDTPSPSAGLALVQKIHDKSPSSLVLVLSPRKSFDAAVSAFRAGAHDVIMKTPESVDYLKARVLDAAGDAETRRGTSSLLGETRDALEDFLKQLMAAERRVLDLEDKVAGRDTGRSDIDDEVRILCVDSDSRLYKTLSQPGIAAGFTFAYAQSGGEALDYVTGSRYHIALIGPSLPDFPLAMLLSAIRAQAPEMILIAYELNGRLDIVDGARTIKIVPKFTAAAQLVERLQELSEAHRAKGRERRYLAAFREKQYEFLRRLNELRKRIEKAIEDEK